jgi:hypothetical protein
VFLVGSVLFIFLVFSVVFLVRSVLLIFLVFSVVFVCGVRVAHLFSFLCCVFSGSVLLIFLVFYVVF